MTEDQAPPTPLPPAAQAPYPSHPAPHPHSAKLPVQPPVESAGVGGLGIALLGGAVAAAIGLLVAVPLFQRRAKASQPKRKASAARKRQPRTRRAPAKTTK
jgi:hypothetical protein